MSTLEPTTLPEIISTEQLIDTTLFTVERLNVRFGARLVMLEALREHRPHCAACVALTDKLEVCLVHESGAGVRKRLLKVPTGRVDPGESAVDGGVVNSARRLAWMDCTAVWWVDCGPSPDTATHSPTLS